MKLGGLESILLGVIVAGITWFAAGMHYKGQGGNCTALTLSPDVKSYIDTSLATVSGGNQCSEIPKLFARIADLQVKLGALEVYRLNKAQKETKQQQIIGDAESIHAKTLAILQGTRVNELNRIKQEIGKICTAANVAPPGGRPARFNGPNSPDNNDGSAGEGQ